LNQWGLCDALFSNYFEDDLLLLPLTKYVVQPPAFCNAAELLVIHYRRICFL